ncbi:protein ANTAGONIST OF LIKE HETEROCHROMATIN PROTEIN 1 [Sergentomyia squamirostris]
MSAIILFMLAFFKVIILSYRRKRTRSVWAHPRTESTWIWYRDQAPENEFRDAFRMSRSSFRKLVQLLQEDLQPRPNYISTRLPVLPEKQVALTLYKLTSCAESRIVADVFGIHKSTVCRYFHRVVKCINRKLMRALIHMPNEDQCQRSSREFEQLSGLPQIIRAVDGSHIPITVPEEGRKDFMNRKNYGSIILQATVDQNIKFIDCSVKYPGSCHDAYAFKNSFLFLRHNELVPESYFSWNGVNVPYLIIGDPAYPLLPWLMKDFYGSNLPAAHEFFNQRLNRARVYVEIAFGRLKGRWRILMKRSEIVYTFMPYVVIACCILHNYVEDEKEGFSANWNPTQREVNDFPQPPRNHYRDRDSLEGTHIRNTLVSYLNQ